MQPLWIKRSTFFFVLPDLTDLKIMYLCTYTDFNLWIKLAPQLIAHFFRFSCSRAFVQLVRPRPCRGFVSLLCLEHYYGAPALIFASMRIYLLRCLLRLEVCVSPILKTRLKPPGGLQGMLLPKVAVWPSPGIDSSSASSQANNEVNKSA